MKSGDFIEIDFTGKVALTGEVFEVTNAEEAKKIGEFVDKARYEPAFIIIGQNMTPKGVEKQLESMSIGDEREFSLMPDDAFGKRKPELVKILSMKDFIKQRISPEPGTFVTIDGRQAKIQSVSGGRVRVDFNHPLAGRELLYKVKVLRQLTEPAEMSQNYLKFFGIVASCSFAEGKLSIKVDVKLKNLVEKMFSEKIKHLIPAVKEVAYDAEKSADAEQHETKAA